MHSKLPSNLISKIAVVFLLLLPFYLFAEEGDDINWLQKEARAYRAEGMEFQRVGNMDSALSFYQKAVEMDPAYAVAYNDLGVLYDAKGMLDKAEENYLKAVSINPNYLSTYTNLALLYEAKRDLRKAEFYWKKRAELGAPEELWTQRARRHLEDIRFVTDNNPLQYGREQEAMKLVQDTATKKALIEKDNQFLAIDYFKRAKDYYKKGDYLKALKEALNAQYIDPSLEGLDAFIEKSQRMALSK